MKLQTQSDIDSFLRSSGAKPFMLAAGTTFSHQAAVYRLTLRNSLDFGGNNDMVGRSVEGWTFWNDVFRQLGF